MRTCLYIILFLLYTHHLYPQMHDNNWVLGQGSEYLDVQPDYAGNVIFNFNTPNRPDTTVRYDGSMRMHSSNGSMSGPQGNLLFYTNGGLIYDRTHQTMANGDSIIDFVLEPKYGPAGLANSLITLPSPANGNLYHIVHMMRNRLKAETFADRMYNITIDMTRENGLGRVVHKNELLVEDSLALGGITAVKHANGRDWWILVPRTRAERTHIGLLDDTGFSFKQSEVFTPVIVPNSKGIWGGGQSVFSPDGSKYIRVDAANIYEAAQINVFDFDRCTGTLSNQRIHFLESPGPSAFLSGVAVSPNSRYLYVFNTEIAVQYDLYAPDIFTTETVIGLWDGFISGGFHASVFQHAQLAPDGRIYVAPRSGTYHLHYVDFPNRPSEACQFVQHGIEVPFQLDYSLPNHPNYRLGPIDGSPCDTLGIDNHPLARWRWEQEDTLLGPFEVTFTDQSAFAPTNWYWTFGDGSSSTEQHPVHNFGRPGTYNVCLVVSNANSSDTLCRLITLEGEAPEPPFEGCLVSIRPNPFKDQLAIWQEGSTCTPEFRLFDALGRLVREAPLTEGMNPIPTADLPAAIYFYRIEAGGTLVKEGKVVKGE